MNYVANLAIDPATKQVDFSSSVPILPQEEVTPQLRENMKQLLYLIMEFFQDELTKLENGELTEEDTLLSSYGLQTDSIAIQVNRTWSRYYVWIFEGYLLSLCK